MLPCFPNGAKESAAGCSTQGQRPPLLSPLTWCHFSTPSDVLDLGNVMEEPPCASSMLGQTMLRGWASPPARCRSVGSLCRGSGGVVGGLGGDSLDLGVWPVWPSGFLGSPGVRETKAEVASGCFGRIGSGRCSPALLWGGFLITRASSILIAVVWSRGEGGVWGSWGCLGRPCCTRRGFVPL